MHAVAVNEVVHEAIRSARPRWKDETGARGVSVEVVPVLGDVPPVQGTESTLHGILVNLLLNAVDAMPEGGRITVSTEAVDGEVEIAVSDTGRGMDKETRRQVFEPFFTTKLDVGSGLGLSTAYGAVTGWGGGMEVESAPGEGTTFRVRLPAWKEEAEEEGAEAEDGRGMRGKLLIVENDEGVSRLLARLLSANYEVEVAAGGREALEVFTPGKYDVAMIDIGMPSVPGDRVAGEMKGRDASLVTVLITGWEIDDDDAGLAHFDFRIRKPFDDLDEVEDVVARAIKLHDERADES